MKKIIIFLILLIIPIFVFAEDIDLDKIYISSVDLIDKSEDTEEIAPALYQDMDLKLNIKMYDVGNYITYKLIINNDSSDDYEISINNNSTNTDYIFYELINRGDNLLKSNNSKELELKITYANEIDDNMYLNNLFSLNSDVNISITIKKKDSNIEKIVNIITPSNEDKVVDNPITKDSIILKIIILIISIILIIYFFIKKKALDKLLILLLLLVPITIYAISIITIRIEIIIIIEKRNYLYNYIENLSKEENACVNKYEGNVTDEVGKTVEANNVYFNNCSSSNIIKLGNTCWKIIRTTETKGTKVLFEGMTNDDNCYSGTLVDYGFKGANTATLDIDSNILYGTSFTYDTSNKTFTLVNTSNEDNKDIIGKYTCNSLEDTCTKMYYINTYISSTQVKASVFTIDYVRYNLIGTGSFNADSGSLSMAGYMFNGIYPTTHVNTNNSNYKVANSFTYDKETDTYTLTGESKLITNWSSNYTKLSNTHYTCWNEEGTCNKISYIFFSYASTAYYYQFTDGKGIEDAMEEMLTGNDINKKDSSIKGLIDIWYRDNMLQYSNMLENTVYCGDRYITYDGATNPNGSDPSANQKIMFNNYARITDLTCKNITDQFSTNNEKAKLKYPVALITLPELNNLTNIKNVSTTENFWTMSPTSNELFIYMSYIDKNGESKKGSPIYLYGIRPSVSLKHKAYIVSGSGTNKDPFIIK